MTPQEKKAEIKHLRSLIEIVEGKIKNIYERIKHETNESRIEQYEREISWKRDEIEEYESKITDIKMIGYDWIKHCKNISLYL